MAQPNRNICIRCKLVFESKVEGNPQACPKCLRMATEANNEPSMRLDILAALGLLSLLTILFIIILAGLAVVIARGGTLESDPLVLLSIATFFAAMLFWIPLAISKFHTSKKKYRLAWGKEWNDPRREPRRDVNYPIKGLSPPAGAPIEDEAQYLISLTDQLIEKAKTMGKDVNTPNNLLCLAKSFMRSKDYDKAKQYAERVHKMVQDTISK